MFALSYGIRDTPLYYICVFLNTLLGYVSALVGYGALQNFNLLLSDPTYNKHIVLYVRTFNDFFPFTILKPSDN